MARARLAWRNHALTATLTGTAATPGTPASNLQTPHSKVPWRAPAGVGVAALFADLGGPLLIGLVVLDALTLPRPGVRVRVSASDPSVEFDLVYDSGVFTAGFDPVHPKLVHFLPSVVTGRHVRVDFGVPNPVELGVDGVALGVDGVALGFDDTIIDLGLRLGAGRLFIGPAVELTRGYAPGWQPLAEERDEHHRSGSGQVWTLTRPAARGARLTFRGITAAEAMTIVEDINSEVGTAADVIVCRDPDSPEIGRDTYWGLLAEPIDNGHLDTAYHAAILEVWERL